MIPFGLRPGGPFRACKAIAARRYTPEGERGQGITPARKRAEPDQPALTPPGKSTTWSLPKMDRGTPPAPAGGLASSTAGLLG